MPWIEVKNEAIKTLVAIGAPGAIGDWREVRDDPRDYELVGGNLIKKSKADLDAYAQLRIDAEAADRQRIGTKIEAIITEAVDNVNPVPLRNFLTRLVLRFRDLEESL